jgi:hypothetical protein
MQLDTRGIPVSQAARRLGISVAAARKRVQRGTLHGYKVDGQWFVILPMSIEASQDTGIPDGVGPRYDDGKDALIAQLREENTRLWDLVGRLAGERALPSPQGVGEGPGKGSAPTMPRSGPESAVSQRKAPEPSPWYRRWFTRWRA